MEFEEIAPVCFGPKWHPVFLVQIPGSKEAVVEAAKSVDADVRAYSDGSGFNGGIGVSVVLYRNSMEKAILRAHLSSEASHTVFEAEVLRISLVVKLISKETGMCMVMIGSDSQAAIRATRNTKGAPGHHLVDKLHEQIRQLQCRHRGLVIELRWMPGHEGLPENECADAEAKKVAQGDSSPRQHLPELCRRDIPASRSAARQDHMKKLKAKAKTLFDMSPRCHKICQINPSTPSSRFKKTTLSLMRHQAALLVQLRMGHVPLQKYLYKIGKVNSARCPMCKDRDETMHHFLIACPAYTVQQNCMIVGLQRAVRSVGTLLANPKAFPHLFKYVHDTCHFHSILGDLQST